MLENDIDAVDTFVCIIPTTEDVGAAWLDCTVVERGILTTADTYVRINDKSCLAILIINGICSEYTSTEEGSIYSIYRLSDIILILVVVSDCHCIRV